MGLSFRLTAVKELKKRKKKKKLEVGGRRCRRDPHVAIHQIPEDVLTEILLRLPAKSLMRLKCVSKLWCSLISSRYFTNLFLKTRQQRRLFMHLVNKENHSEFALFSSLPNPPDSDRAVSLLKRDLNMPWMGGELVSALRGLLCVRVQGRLLICNLTTKQLVELPPTIRTRLVPNDDNNVWDYFCHDPVHDEYKALNIVWEESKEEEGRVVRSEHQVLVLGPGVSWRNIKSSSAVPPPPHRPCSKGISINGVLYYGACTDKNTSVVMSFDLRSEEFTLIKLPLDVTSSPPNLMNYGGTIAVFEYSVSLLATNGTVDLWTLEDGGESMWSNKKTLVLPVSLMDFASHNHLKMQSTTRSSEVWLAKAEIVCNQHVFFVTYDFERHKITSWFKLNPLAASIGTCFLINFWDDTETIMYLET